LADQGGAIQNAGNLSLLHVVLAGNEALGDSRFTGVGGGIFNAPGANVSVTSSRFEENQAIGGVGFGLGGALFNLGSATIADSRFEGNVAAGGDFAFAVGAGGQGGAISSQNNAILTVSACTFDDNQAVDGRAILALGGAIDSEVGTTLTVDSSLFSGNTASGSVFASGGAVFSFQGSLALTGCTFTG